MSEEHRHDDPHVHEEAHGGHSDTTFEGSDASVKMVLGSLAVIGLTLFITAIITFPIQNIFKERTPLGNLPSPLAPARVVPPEPRLQVHPWETLPELRAHEDQVLNSSGTDAAGKTHIPIDTALEQVSSQLKIRPNAPEGITIPGGQGRDFLGSVNALPPSYQNPSQIPAIQGEIQKNAKR